MMEIFIVSCKLCFAIICAASILFIAGIWIVLLIEVIPNKWQKYIEGRQQARKSNAHTN